MMEMCGTPLWDPAVTWDTDNPDFTPCFHKTVLVAAPALLLILLTPFELYFQRSSKHRHIPWGILNITRLSGIVLLLITVVIEFWLTFTSSNQLYIADILGPIVKLFTFTFALMLAIGNIKMGVQSSGVIFCFWGATTIADAFTFASTIRYGDSVGQVINESLFTIEFSMVTTLFFLHFWSDPSPLDKGLQHQTENESPEMGASFPNRMTFSWLNTMLAKGWKRPLTKEDLYQLNPTEQSNVVYTEWSMHWKKAEEGNKKRRGRPPTSIFRPLLFTFGPALLAASFIQLLTVLLTQISPEALNLLIGFTNSEEEQWKGYLYMVYLVGINLIKTILNSQYFLEQMLIGLRIRAAMTSALFRKALRLSSKSRKERSVGETVNLMQIDTQRMMDVIQSLNLLWSSPITIILSIYSLWGILGPSCLAGLLVMVLLIPANAALGSKMKAFQRQNMKFKDERMKSMNEVLDGIKVLKLYAWEPSFQGQVEDIRNTEVNNLKKLSYLQALQTFLFNAAPFLVAIASFATFVLIDSANVLDAQIAFVSLSYFNIMRMPLNQLPQLVVSMIQAQVSWERLNNFFNATEVNQNNVTHDEDGDTVISVEHGTFTWDKELPPALSNIHLEVGRGELVAVVGQVGAGKSSLLSALTNDMEKAGLRARANVNGSVSFVPQQAWMQNATLQYNITFGRRYNEKMYNRVLDACALRPDLEILPTGDATEIGEKGINLSGGQKQRVSLARAVYNNGDIYLLDDPLSAVDAHVGKHLFDQVIGPTGLLKNKTRVLVTHGVKYLPLVDRIVVLKDGAISEMGSYKELLTEGNDFADFLIEYIQDEEGKKLVGEDLEALQAVKGDLEQVMGQEKFNKEIKKARSTHSNISGYRSDFTEATMVSKRSRLVNKAVTDIDNPNNKSLVDERTPLKKQGGGGKFGGPSRKQYGANEQNSKTEKIGRKSGRLMQDEKVETKAVSSAVYSFYFTAVGILPVISIFVLNIITQIVSIGTNIWLSAWSDDPNSADIVTRNMYLSVYGVLGFGSAILLGVIALYVAVGGLNASTKLHDKMLGGVLRAPMSFFDTNPKGRIVNRFAKDIDYVDFSIPATFNSLLRQGFIILGTIAVICLTNPIFIAIIVPIGLGYWLLQKVYVATSRQLRRMESSTRSPIFSWFGEAISGIATIKAYGLQERFVDENEQKVDANSRAMEPNFKTNRWLSVRLEMLGNLIILFASLLCVLGRDTLEPGIVGLSLSYAMQVTQNFNFLIRQTSMIENNMVSVERIMEYQSGLPQEATWELPQDPPQEEWPSEGAISLKGLSTRYREGLDLVLKDIDLEVAGGEKVGIVGRTGSGKSSLTLSLFRINEAASGVLAIDGRDISHLGLGTLRSRLTIIPQDPVLFSGSLRLNLDPLDKSSSVDLWRALELAHLKTYVTSLPGGLEHPVAEGGGNLSVGQRQLVCLARACLRQSKVIVLDEATAAIDLETDDLIQATIRKEFKHCTIITIAHRLNTIMDSDRVVVLSDGNLVESDSPARLLAKPDSAFAAMAREAGLVQ